jgi:hypothetical protein
MKLLQRKLTYSNVVSTLCLFLLLGGGAAYAAAHLGKNSVGTKQLKEKAVTTAKLKDGAVTGAKVGDGSLTGSDIVASTLGNVPSATHASSADSATNAIRAGSAQTATNAAHATTADKATTASTADKATTATTADEATTAGTASTADKLGEFGPAGFLQGTGTILRGYQSTSSSNGTVLMSSQALGEVLVDCLSGHSRIAYFPKVIGSLWWSHGGPPGFAELSSGLGQQLSDQTTNDLITAQFTTPTKTVTMVISGHPGATCTYAGQAIVQE